MGCSAEFEPSTLFFFSGESEISFDALLLLSRRTSSTVISALSSVTGAGTAAAVLELLELLY